MAVAVAGGEQHQSLMAVHFCGSSDGGFSIAGNRHTARLQVICAVCPDPINPSNGWYIADDSSIWYFDDAKDSVVLIAGAAEGEFVDGFGSNARFEEIASLLITSDGRTLWCADFSALRQICIATREVTSHLHECLCSLCWDRAPTPTVKPDSAFYCIQYSSVVMRYDTRTGQAERCDFTTDPMFAVWCTPTGHVLCLPFPGPNPNNPKPICVFDPITRTFEPIDGLVGVDLTSYARLDDTARTLTVANISNSIITYTLPSPVSAGGMLFPRFMTTDAIQQ